RRRTRLERRGTGPPGGRLPRPGGAPAPGRRPGRGRRRDPDAPPGPGAPGARPRRLMAARRPQFPVPLAAGGDRAVRLDVAPAPVPDAFLDALTAHLGPGAVVVDGGPGAGDALDDAGRDWWPLSAVWASQGLVPARPAAVARPSDAEGVAAAVRLAAEHGVPLTPAAGRSGVCGGAVPFAGGVALDLTGLAGVVDVEGTSLRAWVRPGTFGADLERTLADHHLTLGHWPQSVAISTVGGWLACRGAGQYSTRYGKI